jgi:hypothetical protein
VRLPVASYNLPSRNAQRLVNCYAQASTGKVPVEIVGTPGAVTYRALQAPGRGLAVQQGILYAVAGNTLYRVSDGLEIGTIPGDDVLTFAAGVTQLVTDNGYMLQSGVVSEITDTDLPDISSVDFIGGYALGTVKGSGQFVWSALNDSSDWDGLGFATAEAAPDKVRRVIVVDTDIHLLGDETSEEWWQSGAPFERKAGGVRSMGVAGRLAATKADNTIAMFAHDRTFRMLRGNTWVKLSQVGCENAWAEYSVVSDCEAISYTWLGQIHVQLYFPTAGETWTFNIASGEWYEQDYRYVAAINHDGKVWVQAEDGTVGYLANVPSVFGSSVIREVTTGHTFAGNARVFVSQLDAICRSGDADAGLVPMVQLDVSYDGGNEWLSFPARELGRMGGYRQIVRWTRLGTARDIVVRLRVSDAVPFTLLGIELEAQGGAK